jgi:mRNA interferase MazF
MLIGGSMSGLPQDSIALCYQVRTLDKSRLANLIAQIDDANLRTQIRDSLRFQLEI